MRIELHLQLAVFDQEVVALHDFSRQGVVRDQGNKFVELLRLVREELFHLEPVLSLC